MGAPPAACPTAGASSRAGSGAGAQAFPGAASRRRGATNGRGSRLPRRGGLVAARQRAVRVLAAGRARAPDRGGRRCRCWSLYGVPADEPNFGTPGSARGGVRRCCSRRSCGASSCAARGGLDHRFVGRGGSGVGGLLARRRRRRRPAAAGLPSTSPTRSPPAATSSAGTTSTGRSRGRATGARCCASRRRRPAYWKAVNLDEFDGVRWRGQAVIDPGGAGHRSPEASRNGSQTITVIVRDLRSFEYRQRRAAAERSPAQASCTASSPERSSRAQPAGARRLLPRPRSTRRVRAPSRWPPPARTTRTTRRDYLAIALPASVGGAAAATRSPARQRALAIEITFPVSASTSPCPRRPDQQGRRRGRHAARARTRATYALAQRLGPPRPRPRMTSCGACSATSRNGFAYTERRRAPRSR